MPRASPQARGPAGISAISIYEVDTEYIGVPHADWLCAPLADPETKKAIEHVWTLLSDHDKRQFSMRIQEKCGRSIGVPAT